MPLRTGRAYDNATPTISPERCTVCSLCVMVCNGGPLHIADNKVCVDQSRGFGCVGCGHCAAVCPNSCITVEGRDLGPGDLIPLPPAEARATHEQLHALLLARRSIREYADREVSDETVDLIISSIATAPMGLPPSDVEILVLRGREAVRGFSEDLRAAARRWRWLCSPWALWLLRPLMRRDTYQSWTSFVVPLVEIMAESEATGDDPLLWDAPLAMYFHSSRLCDPADAIIAATYAMLAAEALGLGSCMIGSVAPFLAGQRALRARYGIPRGNRQGIMVVMGHPIVRYQRAIRRRLAGVRVLTQRVPQQPLRRSEAR